MPYQPAGYIRPVLRATRPSRHTSSYAPHNFASQGRNRPKLQNPVGFRHVRRARRGRRAS
eukprot:4077127-Pyramimonas_sp.AAC.2